MSGPRPFPWWVHLITVVVATAATCGLVYLTRGTHM